MELMSHMGHDAAHYLNDIGLVYDLVQSAVVFDDQTREPIGRLEMAFATHDLWGCLPPSTRVLYDSRKANTVHDIGGYQSTLVIEELSPSLTMFGEECDAKVGMYRKILDDGVFINRPWDLGQCGNRVVCPHILKREPKTDQPIHVVLIVADSSGRGDVDSEDFHHQYDVRQPKSALIGEYMRRSLPDAIRFTIVLVSVDMQYEFVKALLFRSACKSVLRFVGDRHRLCVDEASVQFVNIPHHSCRDKPTHN